jgi:hypothetical protein
MITLGEGKYRVWLKELSVGNDKIYILGGGEKSHIGGVVICEPGKKSNVISLDKHYDYVVLELVAKIICKKYDNKIAVIGGIHIDDISKQEIDKIIDNCKRLAECI